MALIFTLFLPSWRANGYSLDKREGGALFKKFIFLFLPASLMLYVWNASWWGAKPSYDLDIQAHRGVHQTFSRKDLDWETCTATRIFNPTHSYIENTIASVDAAISYGATEIEIDVHPTTDGEFVVFHDWTLDCRTNGTGRVRDQSWAQLKGLDIGYGYTADNAVTHPFRGKYIGAMPRLSDMLSQFPHVTFAINIKSRSKIEAESLIDYISPNDLERLIFIGHSIPIEVISEPRPSLKTITRSGTKSCLISYTLLGWSGYIPEPCRNKIIPIPANYRRLLWGWPYKFESRLNRVGSRSMLIGPLSSVGSTAIDSREDLRWVPDDYTGIVFTNKVEIIGPLLEQRKSGLLPADHP